MKAMKNLFDWVAAQFVLVHIALIDKQGFVAEMIVDQFLVAEPFGMSKQDDAAFILSHVRMINGLFTNMPDGIALHVINAYVNRYRRLMIELCN